jgi:high-affinity nickel permease
VDPTVVVIVLVVVLTAVTTTTANNNDKNYYYYYYAGSVMETLVSTGFLYFYIIFNDALFYNIERRIIGRQ